MAIGYPFPYPDDVNGSRVCVRTCLIHLLCVCLGAYSPCDSGAYSPCDSGAYSPCDSYACACPCSCCKCRWIIEYVYVYTSQEHELRAF